MADKLIAGFCRDSIGMRKIIIGIGATCPR